MGNGLRDESGKCALFFYITNGEWYLQLIRQGFDKRLRFLIDALLAGDLLWSASYP